MKPLILLSCLVLSATAYGQSTMRFSLYAPEVDELPSRAQWMIALCDSEGYTIDRWAVEAISTYQTVRLPSQRYGTYTASFYLDLNGNGKLDEGFFGQPTEPYAFSNNARSMFSKPSIESQRFYFDGDEIDVKVEYHFD